MKWRNGAVVTLLLLIIYWMTLSPDLTWAHNGADGGDLVRAVARGSIPHPPGFPTYLIAGELFIRLPWGEPAWRLNLMSAVFAASTAGLMTAVTRSQTLSTSNSLPALTAGLCLGLAPLFWSQALIAEVYAPAAFFAALTLFLALRESTAWMQGLVWGVGIGVHPVLLFLAPVVFQETLRRTSLTEKIHCLAAISLWGSLGCATMYGPGLMSRGGAPSPWAEMSTFGGWWALVSGKIYHSYLFGLPLNALPGRMMAWAGLLAQQITPAGTLIAGWGWFRLWQRRRSLATTTGLAFGLFSIYAIGYNTTDSLVYLVPALPLMIPWLKEGFTASAKWLQERLDRSIWLILLIPLLHVLLSWGAMDLSDEQTATVWSLNTLRRTPYEGILLTDSDAHTFALWYAQDVLGQRQDVVVIDQDLWHYPPYRKMLKETLPLDDIGDTLSPTYLAHQTARPVMELP